jgi:hypothetical protein
MSKSNLLENDLVALVFNNAALPWAVSNLFVALHIADPGEAGGQDTNECAYTGYARVSVARDNTGWVVTANQAANAAVIQFPTCTAGSETATHFSVGTSLNGSGRLLYKGALSSSLAISSNVRPEFGSGTLVVQED